MTAAFAGGDKLTAHLDRIMKELGGTPAVRIGFLEGRTEDDGTPVPMVAAWNEFGGRIEREPSETTVYRKLNKAGTGFNRKGRFVRKNKADFSSTHYVGAYVITRPPRPFFRNMIAQHKGEWGGYVAKVLKATDFDVTRALTRLGDRVKGQLQRSINNTNTPPLAASTINRKGFAKPLIDTGTMWNSVDYQVLNGDAANSQTEGP